MEENVCSICNGIGWIVKENGVVKCVCKYSDISETIFRRMNIPKRYRDKELSNFVPEKKAGHKFILMRIEDYINSDDFEKGKLPILSYFKKGKIVTLHISIVKKVIGKLTKEKITKILQITKGLF